MDSTDTAKIDVVDSTGSNKTLIMDSTEIANTDLMESSNSINSNVTESTNTANTGFKDSANTLDSMENANTIAMDGEPPSYDSICKMTSTEIKKYKRGIYKNVLLISFSFLLLFMAFESMSKLQSSINVVANLGTFSNAAVYASLIISCMFVPSILINWLKVKWSLVVCVFCYSAYIAAQFYPEFYTLIPTAVLVGIGAAPMWSAKCTYLTHVAHKFAELDGIEAESIVVKFFGIFFFFFQCNSIFGNIISTVVFNSGEAFNDSSVEWTKCGSNYCPAQLFGGGDDDSNSTDDSDNDNFERDDGEIYTIASIFLCCSLAAALNLAFFVDPLTKYGEDERKADKPALTGIQLLTATFRHMKNPYQILIAPLTFWSGIEQGFFGADYTAGFVTCAFGVQILPMVLICYGFCDAISSITSGFVIKYTGRVPMFLFGAAVNAIVMIVMFAWTPDSSSLPVVFVLAGLWGVGDAIWQTQINAIYGVLFPKDEEAAFSNYRLFESFGFLVGFLTQGFGVCVFPKVIMTVIFLSLGMMGYLTIEYLEWKKSKKKQ